MAEAVQWEETNGGVPYSCRDRAVDRAANVLEEQGEGDGGESSETNGGVGVESVGELSVGDVANGDAVRESRNYVRRETGRVRVVDDDWAMGGCRNDGEKWTKHGYLGRRGGRRAMGWGH